MSLVQIGVCVLVTFISVSVLSLLNGPITVSWKRQILQK